MELPFKSQNFETDFKTALGFIDIDIPFNKIRPDLWNAADELINTISLLVYEALIANQELDIEGASGATTPYQDEELTHRFKYALACMAYKLFSPANDLSHTANGRKMRTSDDTKTPFEWMMVRDDDNLEIRAYKALDALIKYMDAKFDTWKESLAFKKSHSLFLRDITDFNEFYLLESRLLMIKLQPGIKQCEEREIRPRFNQEQYDSLKTKALAYATSEEEPTGENSMSDDEKKLLVKVKEACAYYALYWAFPRLTVNLLPEGIMQKVRGDRKMAKGRLVPQFLEVDQAAALFKSDCDAALRDIESLMDKIDPPETAPEPTTSEKEVTDYGFTSDDNFVNT